MSSTNPTKAPPPPEASTRRPPRFAASPFLTALEIARPHNCAITFASVLLGGWLGRHTIPPALLLTALSAALIMAGGNVLNDLCDIQADRVNRPDRPLPSGRLPVWAARLEAFGLLAAGIGLALALPPPTFALALIAAAGIILYSAWLKGVPLAGNLLIGLLCGLTFLYGGFAVGAPLPACVPALFAALFHLGREILKDVEDREGDRLLTGSTLPLRFGRRNACILITAIYLLLILCTPLPLLTGHYGARYLALVLLLNGLLIYFIRTLWRNNTPESLRRLSRLLKLGMVLGLSAIFIDSL